MPIVKIDDKEIEVPKGTTILQAARMLGKEYAPPAMCFYTSIKGTGGFCRTCLVRVSKGSAQNPAPMPKLVPSCKTEVMDGMEVESYSNPQVLEARKGVVEFLLLNHPLDCPICDQAGECKLQDLAYEHGAPKGRNEFHRREYEPIDIGDKIKLHMNRCIHCYRCVKLADMLAGKERVHGMIHRGENMEISTYIKNSIDHPWSGNIIDVCPVGALTDKTFRFKSRVWFSKPMDAHRHCNQCSGKVRLWLKGNEVLRVTARPSNEYGEVTDFICNECRFEKKSINDWKIEGPSKIDKHSVISINHYEHLNQLKVEAMKHQKALGFIPYDKRP